jgi:hypothetical protein
MGLVGSVTCVVGWDVCGTLCFCVVVMPCRLCLAIAFWGCRGWVAVGGIGEGNTRSASLYNESNLNKLNVLFFAPPPPPQRHNHALAIVNSIAVGFFSLPRVSDAQSFCV